MKIDTKIIELRFPSCSDRLKLIRAVVCTTAGMYGFGSQDIEGMVLAVNEACMNIIQHGYGKECVGEIVLEVMDRSDHLVFRLTDSAPVCDKSRIKSRDLEDIRPGGLGVHLMKQVMDDVEYKERPDKMGNIVEMSKKLPDREGV